ncbi:MAG: AEC family transporter [Lawsonibacter sp.]
MVGVSLAQSMMGNNGVALMSMAVGLVVPTYNTLAVITLESCRASGPDPVHLVKSILRNPLIIGCALGGLCLGLHIPLPGSVVKAVSSVGNAGSVTTLVALGASLKLGGMQHNLAAIVRCSFVRLVLAPLCALVPAILLGLGGRFRRGAGVHRLPRGLHRLPHGSGL